MRPQFKFKQKPVEPVSRFIETYQSSPSYSKKEKNFLGFKRFIFRYRLVFFGVMLALLMVFSYFYYLTSTYKSEVTVSFTGYEIPDYSESGNAAVPGFATLREGLNRMYNLVYSKEMFDHLINKFNLYSHFGLDPATPSSYVVLRKIVKDNITLYQGASRALTIQVTDKVSGEMSMNIANEIANKANEMNKNYIKEKMESRIQVYSKLHDEIKNQTQFDIAGINQGIDQLNSVLDRFGSKSKEADKLLYSLNSISEKIQSDVGQLLTISKVNNWTLNVMKDDVLNNVLILQDALPGTREENFPKWLLITFAFIASFFTTLFLFNLAYTYRNYLHLLKA